MLVKRQGGLFIKKILFVILFVLNGSIFIQNVMAECNEIIYYAQKEWVTYFDFFDVDFSKDEVMNINSKSVSFRQNVFGTHSEPKSIDSSSFYGLSSYTTQSNGDRKNPNYFRISFGKSIKVGKIRFKIVANDIKTNQPVNKRVYINGYPKFINQGQLDVEGSPIYITQDNDFITLDLGMKEIDDIVILFDGTNNEYTLSFFQILDYEIYETVGWTREKIDGVETKKVIACTDRGTFDKDGSGSWVKEDHTVFSPAISLVSDYTPVMESQSFIYDWGKGRKNTAYVIPSDIVMIGENAKKIKGWNISGEIPYVEFRSYADKDTQFEYIMTDSKRGVQYVAIPMYWAPSMQVDYVGALEYNKAWCNHVTGMSISPCYKHYGHSANERTNVFDVQVKNYKEVIPLELRAIEKVEYYLINEDSNTNKFIRLGQEEVETFDFKETGRWRIQAILYDLAGNLIKKTSNLFLIDAEKPKVEFDVVQEDDKYPEVMITPIDYHSGIKRWKYEISTDGGKTFSSNDSWLINQKEKIILTQPGEIIIRAYVEDQVGNTNQVDSDVIVVDNMGINVQNIIAPSYDKNEETNVYIKLECKGCKENPEEFSFYVDHNLISKHRIQDNEIEIIQPYIPTEDKESQLKFTFNNDTIELKAFEKTQEYKESNQGLIEFEGIVANSVGVDKNEHLYKEKLILTLYQGQQMVMSGSGVDIDVKFQYQNECRVIENFECKQGIVKDDGTLDNMLEMNNTMAQFEEGGKPFIDQYMMNGVIQIPLINNGEYIALPQVFLDQKTGLVYGDNQTGRIDGGNRWYTNPWGDLKEYEFTIQGFEYGTNHFDWKFAGKYGLSHHYYDDFRTHFVDPRDPFKNGESAQWKDEMEWFNSLDLNNPVSSHDLDAEKN
ncbi:MAG: hypothetical protein RR445_01445 [Anaerorhabdus sp.]